MTFRAIQPLAAALFVAAAALSAGAFVFAGAQMSAAQDDPTNIVADQIRAQGYACDKPETATRDAQASRPDEAVWILQCESGSYRVRLIPDMAATVEKIDKTGGDGK
jgi:hypothetical protein